MREGGRDGGRKRQKEGVREGGMVGERQREGGMVGERNRGKE